ncbi:MAG: methylmalonyl-CoA mutase family protein [Bacteroidia bacterium]
MFDFEKITQAQWEAQILKDLKGKPLETLHWKVEDLSVSALATAESWKAENVVNAMRRGNIFNFMDKGDWQIVQHIETQNLAHAASLAQLSLKQGVQALLFSLDKEENKLEKLLATYDLQGKALHLASSSANISKIYTTLKSLVQEHQTDFQHLTGTYNLSLSAIHAAHKANFLTEEANVLAQKESPYFRVLGIDVREISQKGATLSQQLAASIGILVEYIECLKNQGISIEIIAQSIAFYLPISAAFFPEIAKLRALRILVARVFEIYGLTDENLASPYLLSETSTWNKPVYDAYNNLLRTTTEAMSAVMGGTNALIVRGYDASFQTEDAFSARLATNIQHLLKQESYLDKVSDAVGGAYYVEQLTDTLAQKAWAIFQTMESKGGYFEANTWFEGEMQAAYQKQQTALAKRKAVVVGVNQYPNTQEVHADVSFEKLRMTSEFEALRQTIDKKAAQTGERPSAILFQFGEVGMRNARALFARNVLGCLGLEIQEYVISGEISFEKEPSFIVFCGADADYFAEGKLHIEKIRQQYPQKYLILAGKPENWESLGVNSCLFAGMNVLEYLQNIANL